MKEIEFLTVQCKMGATTQRQYLEAKFPGQIIYNEDLYYAIQNFRPQNKNDSNDAAKLYTRLLLSSQENPMWKVAIKFDDNNTLTHLFWMSPSQLELWYQFSDIVVQDVTCKTNRYDMALSLFVVLDENRNIRLVAQALLIDETKESHEWSFKQINLATDNMHPRVIMTDSDPAVHAAIRSTFVTTYPMHCTFHISQNLIKKLQKLLGKKFHEFSSWFYDTRNTLHKPIFESKWKNLISKYPEAQEYLNNLYNTKEAWAHPWTCRQFTAGLHASSPVESINAWIKSYIFNSNISLCELANIIDKRQFSEDKNYQLILWKAAIPCISTHVSTSAFMFSSIDKKLEEYLPPAILELQRNEIRQCVFYDAIQVNQEIINEFDEFGNNKNIPSEIMKEIEFLTVQCKMGATTQRQYLEAKFPGQIIYNEDLYYAIQNFRPQNKNDSNDAAKLYTRLLLSSQENPMWKVAIKFDDNNTLTHLFWMSPSQLELWYQFSDIVVQDVTCKTNRYDMALSLFVVLDENRNIRLVAQALLIDETKESHEWSFKQINLATDNMHPRVIMTDSDPAVHAAIRSTFVTTYPMHCTFHISQNLIKKLQKLLGKKFHEFSSWFYDTRNTLHKPIFESKWKNLISKYPEAQEYLNNLYNTKEAWAHPWTCRQFTAGLHASSPVESINAWIKSYIFNSNISLCELANIIDKRQFSEDKNYQLILWKAAIPCISTHVSTSAFMFSSIDKKLEEYLPPAILELQRNEIRQCVFYDAIQVNQEIINEFDEYNLSDQYLEDMPDARQTTASCMIFDVNKEQITSMWAVSVGNKLIEKHFIILLSNNSHHCSCLSLINREIVCRHYFQIMFRSPIAKFHIRLIPSRWYYKNKDPSKEPFLVATKFEEISIPKSNLDNNFEDLESNKENQSHVLKNPNKQKKSKGRPKGTKRIKAFHEKSSAISSGNSKQYKCSHCGNMGHNKRNCDQINSI
ncbi:hypothetical protein Glove_490g67 [Diversispora epigaea]|uniref:CCHC-type domain-containing protein n=1 Tax=Diversispora epigaea TaxID=1348612 RepID=A0A397GIR0_9GLOM|nr:hypothetical protein Glove_490g67 [Diversispora epigaea]